MQSLLQDLLGATLAENFHEHSPALVDSVEGSAFADGKMTPMDDCPTMTTVDPLYYTWSGKG